jgi:hypothetical protein
MRKFLPAKFILAAGALGLGLAAASLATASYSPDYDEDDAVQAIDIAEFPAPVASTELFVDQAALDPCMSRQSVVDIFLAEQKSIGGRVVAVDQDREQALAEQWRKAAGAAPVEVSAIVGHIYFDRDATEWMVDVVEFDRAGCAMTRTLLPGDLWAELLHASAAA